MGEGADAAAAAARLERAWVLQLGREYEAICLERRLGLVRPLIELAELPVTLGGWDATLRSIRIARRLIGEQPWDVVLHILRHEMAHQAVTDLFGGAGGHGPEFHRACVLVAVPAAYRTSRSQLPHVLAAGGRKSVGSRHLERVRKLLALAASDNANEAALAMAKANAAIMRHNLDRFAAGDQEGYEYRILHTGGQRLSVQTRQVCGILREFFFVEVVLSQLYDPQSDRMLRTVEILGSKENVAVAAYVYDFVLRQLDRLWRRHRLDTAAKGKARRSYDLGVLQGFRQRLRDLENARAGAGGEGGGAAGSSLVLLGRDDGLKCFVRERFPHLSRRKSGGMQVFRDAFDAGLGDGRELTLHWGVTDQGGRGGLLTG